MSTSNEVLQDPLESLPTEVFLHALSFIPPVSIAHSNAVCKTWRSPILSDSVLHQEIDLSTLGGDVQPFEIVKHFKHLSRLALGNFTKVSLDLTSFWKSARGGSQLEVQQLFTSLQASKLLREIQIKIQTKRQSAEDASSLITQFSEMLQRFPKLKLVEIQAPSMVSLEAGDANGRRFTLANTVSSIGSADESSIASPVQLISNVREFVGTGLTKCLLPRSAIPWSTTNNVRILEELEFSRFTLESLDLFLLLGTRGRLLWNFAMQCPRLTSVRLPVDYRLMSLGHEELMNPLELGIPQDLERNGMLRKLWLVVADYHLPIGLADWIGTILEELALVNWHSSDGVQIGFVGSDVAGTILWNCRSSLKYVRLSGVGREADDFPDLEFEVEFPNLQSLELELTSPSLSRLFSKASCPQLRKLNLTDQVRDPGENYHDSLRCLSNLVIQHHSSLTELLFTSDSTTPSTFFSHIDSFIFENLQRLDLQRLEEWKRTRSLSNGSRFSLIQVSWLSTAEVRF